jgi:hypothetical protein
MGLEYTLRFHCKILPEYIDFIQKKYLELYKKYEKYEAEDEDEDEDEDIQEYKSLPKTYRDLIDICIDLKVPGYVSCHELHKNILIFSSYKNQHRHEGDLQTDYRKFMEDVIVPISSEITFCEVECEDFYKLRQVYTDTELRGIPFNLQNKIKRIEHIYDESDSEIIETRVIYKHSIKPIQHIDLNRAYGKGK